MSDRPIRAVVSADGARLILGPDERPFLVALAGQSVEIRQKREQRTSAQNRRYWALLTVAADSLWGDRSQVEELHEDIAYELLKLPSDARTGGRRRMRTPKLNTKDFGAYMDRVVDKLIELGADLSEWDDEQRRMEEAA